MYKNIEEYEDIVGFNVNEAFRTGWLMSRTMMQGEYITIAGDVNLKQPEAEGEGALDE